MDETRAQQIQTFVGAPQVRPTAFMRFDNRRAVVSDISRSSRTEGVAFLVDIRLGTRDGRPVSWSGSMRRDREMHRCSGRRKQ